MKIGLFSIGAGRAAQPEILAHMAQRAEVADDHANFCDFSGVHVYPKPVQRPWISWDIPWWRPHWMCNLAS